MDVIDRLENVFRNASSALREKTKSETLYLPEEIPDAIRTIPEGVDISDATATWLTVKDGDIFYGKYGKQTGGAELCYVKPIMYRGEYTDYSVLTANPLVFSWTSGIENDPAWYCPMNFACVNDGHPGSGYNSSIFIDGMACCEGSLNNVKAVTQWDTHGLVGNRGHTTIKSITPGLDVGTLTETIRIEYEPYTVGSTSAYGGGKGATNWTVLMTRKQTNGISGFTVTVNFGTNFYFRIGNLLPVFFGMAAKIQNPANVNYPNRKMSISKEDVVAIINKYST